MRVTRRSSALRLVARGGCTFEIYGELDLATVSTLESALADVRGPVRLDVRGVTFLDSCGIAALVRLQQGCIADGHAFRVDGCSDQAERVLRMVGLYELFTRGEPGPAGADGADGAGPAKAAPPARHPAPTPLR